MSDRVLAYRHLGDVHLTCDLGVEHRRSVHGEKWLYPTGDTITRDWWGYGQSTTEKSPIYRDQLGQEYARVAPMDFHGMTTYWPLEPGGGKTLFSRKPVNSVRFDELEKLRGKA